MNPPGEMSMGQAEGQAAQVRQYSMSVDEVASGDLLEAVRRAHRRDVILAYLVGCNIEPHKTYDQRDPIAYYAWSVEAEDVALFEAGLDRIDPSWRDFVSVS
jgi:hypothetical protein